MYHFVGIKGSGMSALAQIMKELGYEVQGSDVEKHFFTEEGLIEKGIKVLPFDENNIKEGMKVVKGASFNDDHVEIKKAMELGVPIFTYSELVGSLTKKFNTICIAGCHGKTTTTSMMAHVFSELKGANYLIGDGTGFSNRENDTFILESCEYRRHFLDYTPYYAIITNIDLDHVDYFKDIDDVIDAYNSYANNATKMVIACGNDPYTHYLDVKKPIFYYGIDEDNDIIAKNINYTKDGMTFEVFAEDNYYGFFDLPFYGKHMLLDALAVISVCYYERFDAKKVAKALKEFKGAKRRFTETSVLDNVIIDDYAHHPNEIKATIKAARQKYEDKKLVVIFQPHTFSRTKEFKDQFINVLDLADEAYVMDVHPARENQEDYPDINSDMIISKLKHGKKITIDDSDLLKDYKNTVLLFMSPNDISKLENDTIEKMKNS